MKTLKQQLRERLNRLLEKLGILANISTQEKIIQLFLDCNKEWLQEHLNILPKGEFGEKTMLLILIEELEQ